MNKKLLFLTILLILPIFSLSQEVLNTGLVKGLWFSDSKVFDGQKTIVNAIFYNNSNSDISGTIVFYDNQKEFFKKKISLKKDELEHLKAPYLAHAGKHSLTSKIIEARRVENGEEKELIKPKDESIVFGNKEVEFDFDTDGDQIGNKIDDDDDNDGYSDKIEIENGSDPLSKISTPKTVETIKKIDKIQEEVKEASKNIFSKIDNIRERTKTFFEKKVSEKKKNQKIEKEESSHKEKRSEISGDVLSNNETESAQETETSFYLIFLKIMITILNSVILSILFFIFIIWIIYKIIKKIFF